MQKLKFGLWMIESRPLFKKALIAFLALISAIGWSYSLFNLAEYLIVGRAEDKKMAYELTTIFVNNYYLSENKAQDLTMTLPQAFNLGEGKYDIIAKIKNTNKKWYGYFNFTYFVAGKEYKKQSGFILPEEEKFLMLLGEKFDVSPSLLKLKIDDMKWKKIDSHVFADWKTFKEEHLNILVENKNFVNANEASVEDNNNLNRLTFTITNKTAYNYASVNLNILLNSYNGIVGANNYLINDFSSGEKRDISMTWAGRFGQITNININPEVDILNEENYLKFTGNNSPESTLFEKKE